MLEDDPEIVPSSARGRFSARAITWSDNNLAALILCQSVAMAEPL